MAVGALLKTFIYVIASSLLYPVLFLLVFLTAWIVIQAGGVVAEWLERARLKRRTPAEGAGVDALAAGMPHRVRSCLEALRRLPKGAGRDGWVES